MNWQAFGHRLIQSPIYQAAGTLALMIIFTGMNSLFSVTGMLDSDQNTPYVIVLGLILFFALFNSIFSLKSANVLRYFSQSIISYMGLLIAGFFFAYLVSSMSIDEAGSFRWLIVVMTLGYLIILVIVRLMKRIVQIALKQDKRLRGEE